MKVTKETFRPFISEYNEDELFYRELFLQETRHPDTFSQYLASLDQNYVRQHRLFIPAIHGEKWYPYLDEKFIFQNIPGNILLAKHNRYTPIYTHEHEFFEVLCIYDGQADTDIQGIRHTLHTGDICIIPPNTKHSLGIFDDSIAFNIIVRASAFQSTFFRTLPADSALFQFFTHVLYEKTAGNYLIFHAGSDENVTSVLTDLYVEYLNHEKYSSSFLNILLMTLWATLLRYHENHIESILTKKYADDSIMEILVYLNRNYLTATLGNTAEHFGYSKAHFSTLIKEATGRTFLQIIKEIKLSQACRALKETSLSIASICELAGYETPEHFMRTFKKVYGMTPGTYRRKQQNRELPEMEWRSVP